MEALARAQQSRDLQEAVEGLGDVDWLRAAGMVGQRHATALAVWRLVELRDPRALQPALEGVVGVATRMQIGRPGHVATDVLSYLTNSVCKRCAGRGFRKERNSPYLTADRCKACDGGGRRKPRWGRAAHDLAERVAQMQQEAAAALTRKLA
jgi:hypothetical protein